MTRHPPPHRPSLGGGWTLWPQALLRGAGLPFSLVETTFRAADQAEALRRAASDSLFREAVLWQNRPALARGIDGVLTRDPRADSVKLRKSQRLTAKYLQRYGAKNDTIGFFGPVGWVRIDGNARFSAGPSLIADRATFFEPWAVRAIADACASDDRLRAPVTLPGHLRLKANAVKGPTRRVPLSADEVRLLKRADGRPAHAILAELERADPSVPWFDRLRSLWADGLVRWEFSVCIGHDPAAPWRALGGAPALARADAARADVARAAGCPAALDASLARLEAEFVSLTNRPAYRNPGRTYAGRGLVYEECRRDVTLELGPAAVERIGPVLGLIARMARWFTFRIAVALAADLRAIFAAQERKRVPLHVFWRLTEPLFAQETPVCVAGAAERLRELWNDAFAPAEWRAGAQHLSVEQAEAFVSRHFQAPCPGWPGARHHAPDVMWAAPDPEALLAGRGVPVLAECHPAVTPFTTLSVLSLCPVRPDLEREWRLDFPEPRITPIPVEDFARSTQDARLAAEHWHLDLGGGYVSDRPGRMVLRAADLDVVSRDGRLFAVHKERGLEFDLLAVFERRILLRAAVAFSLSQGGDAGPRRYVGPMLVQRAFRRVASPALTSKSYGPAWRDRIRAWRTDLGLPERVFVRSPSEIKPIYVDFASDISVDLFQSMARQSESLSISEMYPGPDGLWLRDGQGRAYTSELRMIAVDPLPFDGRAVWSAANAPCV